ncbi:MAG TPA: hypothetical protein VL197_00115 [Nitrospirota bacterium]|nr:hypothetical protein [Nitrospirota bacterium]
MRLVMWLSAVIAIGFIMVNVSFAETQTVCAGSVPAGWLRIDDRWDPAKCGSPVAVTNNVWMIERYDNKTVGSVMTVCADTVPNGWSIIAQKWDPTKCGKPTMYTENIMTIKRLNEQKSAVAVSEQPAGLAFVYHANEFAARVKSGKEALATPEGQQYASSWGESMKAILTSCVLPGLTDPANLGRFTFVADISASGTISSIEVSPITEVSRCFALQFGKAQLPSPPMSLLKGEKLPVADDIVVVP